DIVSTRHPLAGLRAEESVVTAAGAVCGAESDARILRAIRVPAVGIGAGSGAKAHHHGTCAGGVGGVADGDRAATGGHCLLANGHRVAHTAIGGGKLADGNVQVAVDAVVGVLADRDVVEAGDVVAGELAQGKVGLAHHVVAGASADGHVVGAEEGTARTDIVAGTRADGDVVVAVHVAAGVVADGHGIGAVAATAGTRPHRNRVLPGLAAAADGDRPQADGRGLAGSGAT